MLSNDADEGRGIKVSVVNISRDVVIRRTDTSKNVRYNFVSRAPSVLSLVAPVDTHVRYILRPMPPPSGTMGPLFVAFVASAVLADASPAPPGFASAPSLTGRRRRGRAAIAASLPIGQPLREDGDGEVLAKVPKAATGLTAQSRREALSTIAGAAVASSMLLGTGSLSANAAGLEDLDLGRATFADRKGGAALFAPPAARFVPPTFAVYAARFLLRYDSGASAWWQDEVLARYSLLPEEEMERRTSDTFGRFARSVYISLEAYVQGDRDNFDVDPKGEEDEGGGSSFRRSRKSGVSVSVQDRYSIVARTFSERYGGGRGGGVASGGNSEATAGADGADLQIAVLFAMLPPQYQPTLVMASLLGGVAATADTGQAGKPFLLPRGMGGKRRYGNMDLPESVKTDYATLLPSIYGAIPTVESTDPGSPIAYTISPPLNLMSSTVGPGGAAGVSTPFGPLASNPLTRDKVAGPATYGLFGLSGAAGCALTHTIVVPLDVVKTRLQTDPERYDGILDGASTIAREEGPAALFLGLQPTVAGYFWYGVSVYPSYSFFKYALSTWIFAPEVAVANAVAISVLAGAMSAVLASLGLTPLEAARIRTVAEPETYVPLGLSGTLAAISSEDDDSPFNDGLLRSFGLATLYAGLPSLMARQVLFGSVKFLSYERFGDAIYSIWPFLKDGSTTALLVSLVAGGLAGSLSSVVSQPADSVLTYVSKQPVGEGGRRMGVLEGSQIMLSEGGVPALFRGLGSRCLWASSIIAGQFFLYDIFRGAFQVTPDDLTQVFTIRL